MKNSVFTLISLLLGLASAPALAQHPQTPYFPQIVPIPAPVCTTPFVPCPVSNQAQMYGGGSLTPRPPVPGFPDYYQQFQQVLTINGGYSASPPPR